MNNTDPPTLAEELRTMARQPSAWIAHVPRLTHIADVLGLLDPHTIKMVERVLTEGVPHGWTAEASSYILLAHEASGREIVASYHGEPITDQFTWWRACASTDDDPDRQVGGDTLAELIELVTA